MLSLVTGQKLGESMILLSRHRLNPALTPADGEFALFNVNVSVRVWAFVAVGTTTKGESWRNMVE